MRFLALLLLATPLVAADAIQALGREWTVPAKTDWSGTPELLEMLVPHPDTRALPRRPVHFALLQAGPFADVTLDVEVRRDPAGSVVLVYAWQDENHFNYAHLHPDSPAKQPVHNGIFHVYGGDRVRISNTEGLGSLPTEEWTPVHLTYSARTHLCEVTVGGRVSEALRGIDLSLGAGRIGLGSFFNAARFRNLKLQAFQSRDR